MKNKLNPLAWLRSFDAQYPWIFAGIRFGTPVFFAGFLVGLLPFWGCLYSLAEPENKNVECSHEQKDINCYRSEKQYLFSRYYFGVCGNIQSDCRFNHNQPIRTIQKENNCHTDRENHQIQHAVHYAYYQHANMRFGNAYSNKNGDIPSSKIKNILNGFHASFLSEWLMEVRDLDHKVLERSTHNIVASLNA